MLAKNDNSKVQTTFELIDAGTSRSDLTSRRETKYPMPQMDVGKMRSLLETNCRRLIHSERVSVVRSIYFDDVRLSACRANINGIGMRRKFRLRWYDSQMPETDFFSRSNGVTIGLPENIDYNSGRTHRSGACPTLRSCVTWKRFCRNISCAICCDIESRS